MKLVAVIRSQVAVEFDADVDEAPEIVLEPVDPADPTIMGLANRDAHERAQAKIEKQRATAARRAERDVVKQVKEALAELGVVGEVFVEEVHE